VQGLIREALKKVSVKTSIGALILETNISTMLAVPKSMYDEGMLWRIVREILKDLFVWTILVLLAKLVAMFTPAGWAIYAASLAFAVGSVVVAIGTKPASCGASKTDSVSVILKSISFCYDATGSSNCALPVRKNAAENVTVPEWDPSKKAASESPAAYAISLAQQSTPSITAKFVVINSSSNPIAVQIQALGGGVLGAIAPFTLTCNPGTQNFEQVIQLTNQTFAPSKPSQIEGAHAKTPQQAPTYPVGVSSIDWTWQYCVGAPPSWTTLLSSKHRIYVLLATPTAPWALRPDVSYPYLPWTEMLEFACTWANGVTTVGQAASMITTNVNSGLGLTYQGNSVYTTTYTARVSWASQFNGTGFLRYLNGITPNLGSVVNCRDCATIVATFANALGCNLTETLLANTYNPHGPIPQTTGFLCNEIISIGAASTAWAYPFPPSNSYSYHEVAMAANPTSGGCVYDACLQVDQSGDPWTWPGSGHTPLLPTGMEFDTSPPPATIPIANPPPFTALVYRERLAQNSAGGIGSCLNLGIWVDSNNGRRLIF
jgi:hypothetical protein